MRYFLLLVILSAGYAADYVTLTLKDGRVLTGEYDPYIETLTFEYATINIRKDQIVRSVPAERVERAPAKIGSASTPSTQIDVMSIDGPAPYSRDTLVAVSAANNEAAKAYAEAVAAHYILVLDAAPPLPPAKEIDDRSTVADMREAEAATKARALLSRVRSEVEAFRRTIATESPNNAAIRATELDRRISFATDREAVALRELLAIPHPSATPKQDTPRVDPLPRRNTKSR